MNWKPNIEILGQGLHQAANILVKKGTAMGPLVPLLLLTPIFLIFSWGTRNHLWLSIPSALMGVGIPVFYMYRFTVFANSDPDRLQSEEFQAEIQRRHHIAAKELTNPVPVDTVNLGAPIFNPNQKNPSVSATASSISAEQSGERT